MNEIIELIHDLLPSIIERSLINIEIEIDNNNKIKLIRNVQKEIEEFNNFIKLFKI